MRLAIAILITVAALAGACGNDSKSSSDQQSAAVLAEAEEMYKTKCERCHGVVGNGNGPFAGTMRPRPHNYTDQAWQASVTDDQLKEMILRGGVNMGKSPAMPGYPSLKHRPDLLDALIKLLRSYGQHP
jgi:mono/diheme cytochrome c family protein